MGRTRIPHIDANRTKVIASGVTANAATLTLTEHTGSRWLKKTAPMPAGFSTAGEADLPHALSNRATGRSYTCKVYRQAGCNSVDEIASASFTTP